MNKWFRSLRIFCFALGSAWAIHAPLIAQPAVTPLGVDYLILVDISGSMEGRPAGSGYPVIFPQVKEALSDFIRTLDAGATLSIWPFAGGLESPGRFTINSQADVAAAIRFVEQLQATGQATWVYQSMVEVFEGYIRARSASDQRVAALMVFTDGADNGPDRRTMKGVVEQFGLSRREGDFLYYATLGVDIAPADRQALADAPFATLVESPRGEVVPIVTIQPLLQVLDFGNLRVDGQGFRVLPLAVRGSSAGQGDMRIRIEGRFDVLEAQGAFSRILPEVLPVSREARIGLEILNAESIQGDRFEGFLELQSLDPAIIVTPSRIRATFSWQPARVVRIVSPCPTPASCDLGTLRPWRAGMDEAELSLRLDPDTAVRRAGGNFVAEVFPDAEVLRVGGRIKLNGSSGQTILVDASADSLTIRLTLPETGVSQGVYGALIRFENSTADVVGLDSIRIQVEVPRPPRTPGEWALLVLMVFLSLLSLFFAYRYVTTGGILPPKMRGRLDVIQPRHLDGTSIRLAGLNRIQLGAGAMQLSDMSASIELFAQRRKGRTSVRLRVVTGDVLVKSPGDSFATPVSTVDLGPDDQIMADGFVIVYQSFS